MIKQFALLLTLILGGLNVQAQNSAYSGKANLISNFTLTISGIEDVEGEIRIAIFDSRQAYDEKEDPVHAVVIPVDDETIRWSDDGFKYGEYAIAVYHDKNENGELDTNFLGIPKESYGFSNDARGKFGPASWKDAHFDISTEQSTMIIKID